MSLKLGEHEFPAFDALSSAFGARLRDYPKYEAIPEEFRRGYTPFNKAVSTLFFSGGSLADVGLKLKPGTDKTVFFRTLKSLLTSFDPPHEHKDATCAWLLSEYTEKTPA